MCARCRQWRIVVVVTRGVVVAVGAAVVCVAYVVVVICAVCAAYASVGVQRCDRAWKCARVRCGVVCGGGGWWGGVSA